MAVKTERLPEQQCFELLAARNEGRVALTLGALPAILPVGYHVQGSEVVIPVLPGSELLTAGRDRQVVCLQVNGDSGDGHHWNVLVTGRFEELPPDQADARAVPHHPSANGDSRFLVLRPEMVTGEAEWRVTQG